ncbi:MAG: hypothetical protein JST35_09415 [Armatimonadetes bacterium]|nr:hypothetical protein [Armatimonadota bacterium]
MSAPFCTHCGRAKSNSKNKWIFGIMIALGACAATLGALTVTGVLRFNSGGPGPSVLSQRSSSGPAVLQATAEPPKPVFEKTVKGMPDNIRQYLEFVEKTEKKKVDLTNNMLAVAMRMLAGGGIGMQLGQIENLSDPDAPSVGPNGKAPVVEDASAEIQKAVQNFEDLAKEFDAVTPPPECSALATYFSRGLNEIPGQAKDILGMIGNSQGGDVTELQKARGKSGATIDRYFGEADAELGRICDHYETRKWFSIAKDIGGDSKLMIPGF